MLDVNILNKFLNIERFGKNQLNICVFYEKCLLFYEKDYDLIFFTLMINAFY